MLRSLLLPALLALNCPAIAQTQSQPSDAAVVPNTPTDHPIIIFSSESNTSLTELDRHIAPAVRKARTTLGQAKRRFLTGLPTGQALYLTTRIKDPNGLVEQMFVRVAHWRGKQIEGTIANQLDVVKTYQQNQTITFPESAMLDWTISRPDGSEEGNYVGKLLDADTQ
ncbi:DUF2314 domain-containing protein [Hymenobacter terrenus]|uniref:DUF2314 domain-containing protein n=1 Tax=Hymenobacter terrenus TaxID=1629124 RepID=UPI00090812B8|nr:DUF2314 domain-containing protein [Hymenobacter terrenus]